MGSMRKSDSSSGGLVYSTEGGRMCPACRLPLAGCRCAATAAAATAAAQAGDGTARVSRSSKGRGGKTVTLVQGLPLAPDALAALGKRLRSACGAGGTLKDDVLEVQGDHVQRVLDWLQAEGYRARRSGG